MAKRTPPQFCEKVIARISEAERYPVLKAQAEQVANNPLKRPEWYREIEADLGKSRQSLAHIAHMATIMRDDAINVSQGLVTWVEPNWEQPEIFHKGMRYAQLFGLMLEWESSPNILQFDDTLGDVILEMPLEEDEPIDFLDMMPFPCFYVKICGIHNEQDLILGEALYGRKDACLSQTLKPEDSEVSEWSSVDGFFVSRTLIESEKEADLLDVHVLYCDGMLRNYYIPIVPGTVKDVIESSKNLLERLYSQNEGNMERLERGWPERERQIIDVLKILQYIGSIEPDIVQVYSPSRNRPKSKKNKRLVAEANIWGVGTRIGARIRLQEQERRASQSDGSGTKVRVHWRRAHKHHYWIGSEKDGTRKRIPKFVEAVLVNADLGDAPTTIRPIGK